MRRLNHLTRTGSNAPASSSRAEGSTRSPAPPDARGGSGMTAWLRSIDRTLRACRPRSCSATRHSTIAPSGRLRRSCSLSTLKWTRMSPLRLVADQEAEAAGGIEPFHRAGELDQRLVLGRGRASAPSASARRLPAGISRREVIKGTIHHDERDRTIMAFARLVNCFRRIFMGHPAPAVRRARRRALAATSSRSVAGAQHRRQPPSRRPPGREPRRRTGRSASARRSGAPPPGASSPRPRRASAASSLVDPGAAQRLRHPPLAIAAAQQRRRPRAAAKARSST